MDASRDTYSVIFPVTYRRLSLTDRCVLAAQSFPLRAMFEGAFKERSESVIALRDVEASSFSLLLDFFYDRTVGITSDNAEALLDLSARYAVSMLRRHCCTFLAWSANPDNACSLLAVADRYDCHRLRRDLLAYILEVINTLCAGLFLSILLEYATLFIYGRKGPPLNLPLRAHSSRRGNWLFSFANAIESIYPRCCHNFVFGDYQQLGSNAHALP